MLKNLKLIPIVILVLLVTSNILVLGHYLDHSTVVPVVKNTIATKMPIVPKTIVPKVTDYCTMLHNYVTKHHMNAQQALDMAKAKHWTIQQINIAKACFR